MTKNAAAVMIVGMIPGFAMVFFAGSMHGHGKGHREAVQMIDEYRQEHNERLAEYEDWRAVNLHELAECGIELARCEHEGENYLREPRCPNEIVKGESGSHAGQMGVQCEHWGQAVFARCEKLSATGMFGDYGVKWFCAEPQEEM